MLYRTQQILVARRTESVIATGHELSAEVSSIELALNRQSFFVHITLSDSTRRRGCPAPLNINNSVWRLLQPGCITRRGRWVLTDVNICMQASTFCTLSSVQLAAGAGSRECRHSTIGCLEHVQVQLDKCSRREICFFADEKIFTVAPV